MVDPRDAARDETLLFPEAGTNTVITYGEEPDEHLFDDCEVVVTRTILNQRVAPAPMEGRAAAAVWGEDGRLTAWIPNQGAQGSKATLATMLGLERDRVRVITPDVGGAFGAKFGADPEHAARRAGSPARVGRPARWIETRYENLLGDDPRPGPGPDRDDRRHGGTAGSSRTGWRCCRTPAPTRGSARCCRR